MSRDYIYKDEAFARYERYRKEADALRAIIVELAATVVWCDKNGYQAKTVDRCLEAAEVKREDVDAFNDAKRQRIAAWRDKQAGA